MRKLLFVGGSFLVAASGFAIAWSFIGPSPVPVIAPVAYAANPVTPAADTQATSLLDLAKRDPLALIRMGMERYQRDVRQYRCTFIKQERIGTKLTPVQEIDVRFREGPTSVYMVWRKNHDKCKRALFVDQPDFVDSDGQKLAKVEPAGAVVRLLVSEVMMPIHGDMAREASRRSMDEFGFRAAFDLLDKINLRAAREGVLDFRFDGQGTVDGRPTFIFVRKLPATAASGDYPDTRFVMHLDQELLLPVALYSYADPEGKQLLGSYVYTDIAINPGLTDADFKF